jgi:sugar phosphate isomerase/epimerase
MLLSIAVGAVPLYPVGLSMSIAEDARADGVELLVNSASLRRGSAAMVRAADERHISILSVRGVPRRRAASPERKLAEDASTVTFAATIPSCHVVTLQPPIANSNRSSQLDRWLSAMRDARASSANPRLSLALECRDPRHGDLEAQRRVDFDKLRHLAGEWDLDIALDITKAGGFDLERDGVLQRLLPRLTNVRMSDKVEFGRRPGRNGERHRRGSTVNPPDEVLVTLAALGYDGLLTLAWSPFALRAWWPWKARSLLTDAVQDTRAMLDVAQALSRAREKPRHPAV